MSSTLNIPHTNAFELADKTKALETLAKLDVDTLKKVATLANCPIKAKEKISKNWKLINKFF